VRERERERGIVGKQGRGRRNRTKEGKKEENEEIK
jgi:hypothetical protein